MPTKSDTRQRLIDAAVLRFYRDGFRGVGIDQVLSDVGISKTAFYKHFESKDDLLLAALDQKSAWLQGTFRDLVRQRGGPRMVDQLRALFDVVGRIIHDHAFQGCLFVNVAMEFPLPHDPAHIAAAANKAAIQEFVCDLAAQAGADEPRQLAEELCMIMEGAYVTRQVTGSSTTIEIARRLAEHAITTHLSPEQRSERAATPLSPQPGQQQVDGHANADQR